MTVLPDANVLIALLVDDHGSRLATFDQAMAKLHDVVDLVPTPRT